MCLEKVCFSIWEVVSWKDIEKRETGWVVVAHYSIPIRLTKPIKNNEILNELFSSLFNFLVSLKPFQLIQPSSALKLEESFTVLHTHTWSFFSSWALNIRFVKYFCPNAGDVGRFLFFSIFTGFIRV